MAMLNCKIAPFVFWLCFLALSFFTTFNGQSQSARTSSRDRPEPAKPLCQEGPRGARGPLSGRAAENGLSPPATMRGQRVFRERTKIAAAGLTRGQAGAERLR